MGSALAGSNPVADENIFAKNCSCMKNEVVLPEVGFEPTLANETELKSAALDHSAIQAVGFDKSKKDFRSYRDLNPDCWIQSPK